MVSGLTNGIDSALIVVHTRILALLRDTGQHARTVAVDRTLGLALGVRVALQARRTRAPADVSTWSSYGVDAARVGVARVARRRLGPGGSGRRWSTAQASVGATVEAAETPVGTVEVRDAH